MKIKQVGRYEIKSEYGKGAMATVYLAFDPKVNREVAIKIMRESLMNQPDYRIRFEREVRTIASLEHSAIVPVYDFGEHENCPFLVMRLMRGGTLANRIKQGRFTPDEVIPILEEIAPAIDEAHARGIIHRDLKPANILFDTHGHAFLSDFGIVKDTKDRQSITSSDMSIGTPGYMSPEQIDGNEIDGRSDIYMLGVILFRMLTGHLPFEDKMPIRLIHKQMNEPTPDIRTYLPDFPPAAALVIATALEKEPEKRYSTAGALLVAFEAAFHPESQRKSSLPAISTHRTEWGGTKGDDESSTMAFDTRPRYWQQDGRLVPAEPQAYPTPPQDVVILPAPSQETIEQYNAELQPIRVKAERLADLQRQALNVIDPSYSQLLALISQWRFWERRPKDEAFLKGRVGTGMLPATFSLQSPSGFEDDERVVIANGLVKTYKVVGGLPLTINLNDLSSLHISGVQAHELVNTLLLNLAIHHAPEYLHIYAFAGDERAGERWQWLKWLPHTSALANRGQATRLALNQEAIEAVSGQLSAEIRRRQKELHRVAHLEASTNWPHLVILADNVSALMANREMASLRASGRFFKAHALVLGEAAVERAGTGTLEIESGRQLTFTQYEPERESDWHQGKAEPVTVEEAEEVARRVAPVRLVGPDINVVEPAPGVRFPQLFGAGTSPELEIQRLYRESVLSTAITVPIGADLFGKIVSVPVVDKLPMGHILVCGEADSDRKNLLRTMILGLGSCYSPKQIRLVAATLGPAGKNDDFNFSIPHLKPGRICSNGSELAALQDELRQEIAQRRRLFSKLATRISRSIPDLATYNRNMAEAPLARIVLIVDGYTADWQNAWQQFLTGMGKEARDTGLHLILGVRETAGITNDWLAEFPLRLCLRVSSSAASSQIIGHPSAANLAATRPGLGYFWRQETGKTEMFQAPILDIPRPIQNNTALDDYGSFAAFTVLPDGSRELLLHHDAGRKAAEIRTEADLVAERIMDYCRQIGYQAKIG